jgi:hypothetical protein
MRFSGNVLNPRRASFRHLHDSMISGASQYFSTPVLEHWMDSFLTLSRPKISVCQMLDELDRMLRKGDYLRASGVF